MTPACFDLERREHPGAIVLEAGGEIDASNAEAFEREIREVCAAAPAVLDLSGVEYLDSAGFAALDRLLTTSSITIVLRADSVVYKAATLMALPHHPDLGSAAGALERP